jgi:hypothetical protein
MAFVEDLTVFFNPAEFAVAAVFKRGAATVAACNVIFDDPTQQIALYEQGVEEAAPRLRARTADVAAVRRNDLVTVNAVIWRVERLANDGTGVSTLYLARN